MRTTFPAALVTLSRSVQFWKDYFWEDGPTDAHYPDLADCTVRLEVAPGWALTLALDEDLAAMELSIEGLGETAELGWDDQAHWHPHVLRWEELDLIGRAAALRDPAASHPGLAVLLLYRFAPICDEADAELAFPLLETAWAEIGVDGGRAHERMLQRTDARTAGFKWQLADGRWVLSQDEPNPERELYTLRNADNDEFPHHLLEGLVRAARYKLKAAEPSREEPTE